MLTVETPKIESRTYQSLLQQTEDLVARYAGSYLVAATVEQLVGQSLAETIIDPSGHVVAEQGALIDQNLAARICTVVGQRRVKVKGWSPNADGQVDFGDALTRIFAHLAEVTIARLNRVPEKNFYAFLNLLGIAPLPPRPARAPLTFTLAPATVVDTLAPAGTQVAALPAAGEKNPVIFETERELTVTAAQLTAIFTRDPYRDHYTEHRSPHTIMGAAAMTALRGQTLLEHTFYLGDSDLLSYPQINKLSLAFTLTTASPAVDLRTLQWEFWDGVQGQPLQVIKDGTDNLTHTGTIVFNGGGVNLTTLLESKIGKYSSRWLRCRLMTPISKAESLQAGMVRQAQLPTIQAVTLEVEASRKELPVTTAFANQLALDPSKDCFPFGEKPKFGDTFYVAHSEAFSKAGALVTLNLDVSRFSNVKEMAKATVTLQWELGQGRTWLPLGTAGVDADGSNPATDFKDTTRALTQPGAISFRVPKVSRTTLVNGNPDFWLRARIKEGDYGADAHYELLDPKQPKEGFVLVPATLAPPVIRTMVVGYTLTPKAEQLKTVLYNDFVYTPLAEPQPPFAPFQAMQDSHPALYLGFTLPPGRITFPNRTLSLWLRLADILYGQPVDNPDAASAPRLTWEYWHGAWSKLTVRDETRDFTRSGLVEFLAPADFTPSTEFGLLCYWLRVRREQGQHEFEPRLQQALLNTTSATQTVTIRNELLGSSDGSKNQTFRAAHPPLLLGQQLLVRELEAPPQAEQLAIADEEGEDAITILGDATGQPKEIWVRWHAVPDFYASGRRDRHYTVDHSSGEVQFGDGLSGLIPPIGANNIRLAQYQTGGGVVGNRPVNTIVQLKTTIPYVDKVCNVEPATGGAEAEAQSALRTRGPAVLRHRERAVTAADYEDLACLASPAVARAKCVPLRDLLEDPFDQKPVEPGQLSMIIVPHADVTKPLPDQELIRQVQEYLEAHMLPLAKLVVVGPLYAGVNVTAEIALISLEKATLVEKQVQQMLARFLHPLTGGLDHTGWGFGREPHLSDLFALIEQAPGVDHVRTLKVDPIDEAIRKTGRFLVYSGVHRLNLVFEET